MKISSIFALSGILFFWGVSDIKAQNNEGSDKTTTLSAGWVNSTITSDVKAFKEENRSSFFVGVQKTKKIVPILYGASGLFYYQCGTANQKLVLNENNRPKDGDVKLNYLQIPLGLRVKIGPAFADAGFTGAYRVSGKIEDDKLKQEDWNRWDATFYAGAGVKILMLSANLRYHWGLVDVYKGAGSDGANTRNAYVALGIGLSL